VPTDSEVAKGFREAREVREKLAAKEAGSLRRAVSDVMDGTLPVNRAVKAHGVSEVALSKALREAGWTHKRGAP
jgi:hypothetical protein